MSTLAYTGLSSATRVRNTGALENRLLVRGEGVTQIYNFITTLEAWITSTVFGSVVLTLMSALQFSSTMEGHDTRYLQR